MNNIFLRLYAMIQTLTSSEEGQDMVEYALVVALLSLAATSAISGLGSAVVNKFNFISTGLAS